MPSTYGSYFETSGKDLLVTRHQEMALALVAKYGSQGKAAKALLVTQRAIKFWIKGLRKPSCHNISIMAAALDSDDWDQRQQRINSYQLQIKKSGRITKWLRNHG